METRLNIADPIAPQMVQKLRQAIVEMQLKPGEALSENDIARRYGVSRQPVREAFIKLSEAGLLQILRSRGTYVVKISVRDVLDARFVREAIECAMARTASEIATPDGLRRLENLINLQEQAVEASDYRRFYALDEDFHAEIARIVECDYAARIVDGARVQTDRVRFLSLPEASPMTRLLAQHRAILVGIASGVPDIAEGAMRTHLREILAALPRLAKAHPELFDDSNAPAHTHLSPV